MSNTSNNFLLCVIPMLAAFGISGCSSSSPNGNSANSPSVSSDESSVTYGNGQKQNAEERRSLADVRGDFFGLMSWYHEDVVFDKGDVQIMKIGKGEYSVKFTQTWSSPRISSCSYCNCSGKGPQGFKCIACSGECGKNVVRYQKKHLGKMTYDEIADKVSLEINVSRWGGEEIGKRN